MSGNASPQAEAQLFGWQYLEGTSQELALGVSAHHILFHGTRGPGKTDVQLMRFRSRVGLGYGAAWRGIIFDREYKNLDDLVTKSKRWFYDFNDGAQFLASGAQYKWRWPTGEELLFRVAKTVDDYWSYHGHEYPFIGWNELTKYPDSRIYDKMNSVNRSSFDPVRDTPKLTGHNGGPPLDDDAGIVGNYNTADGKPLPPIPLEVFSTCNPYGIGHTWVKRKFIEPAPDCTIVRTSAMIYNPKTKQEELVTKKQVAIHGHWSENPHLDPQYILTLRQLTDENERKAWHDGSWDINAGGALSDLWRKRYHVVPRFPVPANWHIDRCFDWGSSHPFSVGWYAESNGETVEWIDKQGKHAITLPAGTIVRCFEWYGTKELGTNKGLLMSAKNIALGIKEREALLVAGGWFARTPSPGPADNQISNVNEADTDTIKKKMEDEGVSWLTSDKSAGSRTNGLQVMRDRLEATISGEGAGFVVMENCRAAIAIYPALPRDETKMDDVDTKSEDHIWDETRYKILNGVDRTAKVIKVKFSN